MVTAEAPLEGAELGMGTTGVVNLDGSNISNFLDFLFLPCDTAEVGVAARLLTAEGVGAARGAADRATPESELASAERGAAPGEPPGGDRPPETPSGPPSVSMGAPLLCG